MITTPRPFGDIFNYEYRLKAPLVVSPKPSSNVDLVEWARGHQREIAEAVNQYALVFSGFGLTEESFPQAFEALTGVAPAPYAGDTPRDELGKNVYKSTAERPEHRLPLHQEVTDNPEKMPQYIAFYCVRPPRVGTGQTLTGSAKDVSADIQRLMPQLWERMTNTTMTVTSRYLPEESSFFNLWERLIRWLNPSHATIQRRFGTTDRAGVAAQCRKEGLKCEWDGNWAVVSRSGIPATRIVDGAPLFCNQIHANRLNPNLCGGWFKYILARALLYPTSRWMQFDVKLDDGTRISRSDASKIVSILQRHQVGRDWKADELMLLNNVTTMHGKTPHQGDRKIVVAMGGTIKC